MSTVADKLARKSSSNTSSKQVRLRLVYVDFWSALKMSFLGGIALAVVTLISTLLVFLVLQATGLIANLTIFLQGFDESFDLGAVFGFAQVASFAAVLAILNLVVVTLLGAVVAGIYNLAVKVTGGLLIGFTSN